MHKLQNWCYMASVANFNTDSVEEVNLENDAPLVSRLGRYNQLKSPTGTSKPKRRLKTAELLDLQSGGIIP